MYILLTVKGSSFIALLGLPFLSFKVLAKRPTFANGAGTCFILSGLSKLVYASHYRTRAPTPTEGWQITSHWDQMVTT